MLTIGIEMINVKQRISNVVFGLAASALPRNFLKMEIHRNPQTYWIRSYEDGHPAVWFVKPSSLVMLMSDKVFFKVCCNVRLTNKRITNNQTEITMYSIPPYLWSLCSKTPRIPETWNHRWYQTLYILYFILYIVTYD